MHASGNRGRSGLVRIEILIFGRTTTRVRAKGVPAQAKCSPKKGRVKVPPARCEVSPELQPDDESVPFSYLSIALVVSGESQPQRPGGSSVGFVDGREPGI
jgi:hypothetical protein